MVNLGRIKLIGNKIEMTMRIRNDNNSIDADGISDLVSTVTSDISNHIS